MKLLLVTVVTLLVAGCAPHASAQQVLTTFSIRETFGVSHPPQL